MAKKHVILFAGTTEGRILANWLDEQSGVTGIVCVATEYGAELLEEEMSLKHLTVHCGRLDEGAMEAFLKKESPSLVIDATHPYAQVVTANIRKACEKYPDICLLRCLRKESEGDKNGIIHVKNTAEAVRYLSEKEGNIFLTTGSKELVLWQELPGHLERIFARVLPVEASVHICRELGYSGRHIIAMQGPFSVELNYALLRTVQAGWLVTKEAGKRGGFAEKIEAARQCGVSVVVIRRPVHEEGISLEEAKRQMDAYRTARPPENSEADGTGRRFLSMIGMGMGGAKQLTLEACEVLERSDIVFGASRMLADLAPLIREKHQETYYQPEKILDWLEKNRACQHAVVVCSGDTGFYSGCRKLYVELQEAIAAGQLRGSVRILPGISSVVSLAARVGESYEDAAILSMHGKKLNHLPTTVVSHEKTFLLTSGSEDIRKIGRMLTETGLTDCEVSATFIGAVIGLIVGYQLSYPEENIRILMPEQCVEVTEEGLYTCLIRNPHPQPELLTHGRADTCFLRDASGTEGKLRRTPMTKEEVREVSICKLHLTDGAVVYDIGSGTGSVAVEIAGLSETVHVYAIERKPEAVELLRKNREHFHMDNMEIIEALAPEGLEELPVPTHAFIGGSVMDILQTLYRKNPHMRIVINAISMETIAELQEVLEAFPVEDGEILQMQVNRVKKLGSYHLPQAENPVWICSFTFREGEKGSMDKVKKALLTEEENGNRENGEVQR